MIRPGKPYPLGATPDPDGTNFAVYSENAKSIDVCLFERANPQKELARYTLPSNTGHVFHGHISGVTAGSLYGLRAHGPYEPKRGLRFNPKKLLVDPYAKALHGKIDWKQPVHPYRLGHKEQDLDVDTRDSAAGMPKAVVVSDQFDWGADKRPDVPYNKTVIYEAHVKGLTAQHPGVPEHLRGTYAGLCHPATIEHLLSLGVTSVELLPVHEAVSEQFLADKGLSNYWGYATLGFFAPDQRFSALGSLGEQVVEFKGMVKLLHQAGIEVLLDVVYNHTGEGNHLGPLLSFRGLDNPTYYWLKADEPRYYPDFTGTGNSLNLRHKQTLKLVMDSLRYWVEEMHVDGFRFDLASTLGRVGSGGFNRDAPFFHAIHQDPVLSRVKLIAEPWDVSDGGYQVGNFPIVWSEWNDRYRDATRKFWKGDERQVAELGYRLTGSSDLFLISGRKPAASVNFVTAHDGFTLHDLVSYDEKHNEANGEGNRDGTTNNNSWNHGVEGETKDAAIIALREQQKRNFLATLFLSQGVPMLLAGDEMGHTQKGNNNAYCQDSALSWIDWNLDERRKSLLEFTKKLVKLKRTQPVLQRRSFFRGAHIWDSDLKDLAWFRPDGKEMTRDDWEKPNVRALGYLLGGDAIATPDDDGRRIVGDTLLVLLNGGAEDVVFTLPAIEWGNDWQIVIDTAHPDGGALPDAKSPKTAAGGKVSLPARSLVVLRHPPKEVA